MKNFLLLLFFLCSFSIAQTSGGPDNFGYTWTASHDMNTGAVNNAGLYNWVDISTSGTKVTGLGDDNFVGPIAIGHDFQYYWNKYNEVYIGSNGYLMFGRGINVASGSTGFPTFPESGPATSPANFIGALVCDLTLTQENGTDVPGSAVYYQTIGDSFIVSYIDVAFWTDEVVNRYRGANSFQIILNSVDSSITINYQSSTGTVDGSYLNTNFITKGIENVTGNDGIGLPSNKYPTASSTVIFDYPNNSAFAIKDVTISWVLGQGNGGRFYSNSGNTISVQAQVTNSGTVDITNTTPIDVSLQVTDYSKENISNINELASSVQVDNLVAGASQTVTFPVGIPALTTGEQQVYRLKARSTVTGDEVALNNDQDVEMVIVDTTLADVLLSYDRFAYPPDNDFHDYYFSGNDEFVSNLTVGNYYEPPFYPCYLRAVEAGILMFANGNDPDTLLGYTMKIYDDDGPNGSAGTLLETINVTDSEIQYSYYIAPDFSEIPLVNANRHTLSNSFQITSGGVYITWEREVRNPTYDANATNFLGTDRLTSSPFSYANFEVAGGVWAPYRDRPFSDFAIRAVVGKDQVTAIQNRAGNTLKVGNVYPNPAQSEAHLPIQLNNASSNVKLTLTDLTGRAMLTVDAHNLTKGTNEIRIPLQGLAKGMYLYHVTSDEGNATGRIQVQ